MRFVFIFLFCINGYAQEIPVVFVDENFYVIPEEVYRQKQSLKGLFESEITSDSVVYKKLYYKNYFGTLDPEKKSQLNKLLYQRYEIDSTKVWVIHYRDSLPDINKLPRGKRVVYSPIDDTKASKDAAKFLNRNRTFSSKEIYMNAAKLTTHLHPYSHWFNKTKQEYERYSKLPEAQLMHFYNLKSDFPVGDQDVKWFNDPYKIIKTLFFEASICYSTLIVHPDGSFFVSYSALGFDSAKALIDRTLFDKTRR